MTTQIKTKRALKISHKCGNCAFSKDSDIDDYVICHNKERLDRMGQIKPIPEFIFNCCKYWVELLPESFNN